MAEVKAVFFDLDDTLYDHSFHLYSAITALREEHSFLQAYSVEHLKQLSHKLLEEVHLQLLSGEISVEEARRIRWQRFLEESNYKQSHKDAMTLANFYSKAYYKSERVVPGSFELLSALKKEYVIGIISNNLLDEQLKKMKRLGISEYIDLFAISEEVRAAKPDPKIFEVALERANVLPEEAVFIGDSWTNDVLGALDAGIRPIWLNRNSETTPDPNVAEIESLQQIEKILSYIRNEIATPQITSPDPANA